MDSGATHLYAPPTGIALGRVTDTNDSQSRGRVKVSLVAIDLEVWATCVVPSAGKGYGISLLPKKDEIVLVLFLTPDQAFVLGSVWSGGSSQHSEAAPVEQRYCIKTPNGTTLLFDDAGPTMSVTTPANNSLTLTDSGGGKCTVSIAATSIEATPSNITVTTTAAIELKTSTATINAQSLNVTAAMSTFSGVIQCDTLVTQSVVSASYSPGAGNIW